MADVLEVSQITANAMAQHSGPALDRRRPVSNDDPSPVAEPLPAMAAPPDIVPDTSSKPFTYTPDSVVDVTWPGQMTYDVDGLPSGMSAPRVYRMTAGPAGTLTRWLILREQVA